MKLFEKNVPNNVPKNVIDIESGSGSFTKKDLVNFTKKSA